MGSVKEIYESIFGCWSGWVFYCNIQNNPISDALVLCSIQFSNDPLAIPTIQKKKKHVHDLNLEPNPISHINTKAFLHSFSICWIFLGMQLLHKWGKYVLII